MSHTDTWMGGWFGDSMDGWMWILPLGGLLVLVLMVVVIVRLSKKRARSQARKPKQ